MNGSDARGYDPSRRTPRGGHRRVVLLGRELFEEDSSPSDDMDSGDRPQGAESDDDDRILRELPPHWAIFNQRS